MTAPAITGEAVALVTARFSRSQRAKALDLIASGLMSPAGNGGWMVPSSDRVAAYMTTGQSCTCPSRMSCYHQLAVQLRELGEAA